MRTKILLLSFLLVALTTATIAVQTRTSITARAAASRKTSTNSLTCIATSPQSLSACLTKINLLQANKIAIQGRITCTASEPCHKGLAFNGSPDTTVTGTFNFEIFGATADAGIVRTYIPPRFSGNLFSFDKIGNPNVGTINATFKNLYIEDYSDSCDVAADETYCADTLSFNEINNIEIDSVHITKSYEDAIDARNFLSFRLINSTIENSAVSPVYLISPTANAFIDKNTFKNNKGNLLYRVGSNEATPSAISRNTFSHNHKRVLYNVCGSDGTKPCGGGQLLLENGTNYLNITSNTIRNGGVENYCTQANRIPASGIEFQTGGIHNVKITDNHIFDNTGAGIAFNQLTDVSNIEISSNFFFNNLKGDFLYPSGVSPSDYGVTTSNNCHQESCLTEVERSVTSDQPTISAGSINPDYSSITSTTPSQYNARANFTQLSSAPLTYLYENTIPWENNNPVQSTLHQTEPWYSFVMPTITAPSGCTGPSCPVTIRALDTNGSCLFSNSLPLNLPPSKPALSVTGVSASLPEWAVYVTGTNLENVVKVAVLRNSQLWAERPATVGSGDITFTVSPDNPPANCTPTTDCQISYYAVDSSNQRSNTLSLTLPKVAPPQISSPFLNRNYTPPAVSFTAPNFNFIESIKIKDHDGSTWELRSKDWLTIDLATNPPSASFTLPGSLPPSQCNRIQSCQISFQLVNKYGQSTNSLSFTLPPPLPTLTSATVQPNWNVSILGSNLTKELKAKLIDIDGQIWPGPWGPLIDTFLETPGESFLSLSLPASHTPPSQCNLNGLCTIRLQLVSEASDPSKTNTQTTNTIDLVLPQKN